MIAGLYNRRARSDSNITALRRNFSNGSLFDQFPYDSRQHWQNNRLLLCQQDRFNSPQSHHENGPVFDPASGLVITAWATLYNREELYKELPIARPLATISDSELILRCYLKWQQDCLHHLNGDYAFVIADPQAELLFCARDPMGIRPFYYQLDHNQFSFASSAGCFKYIAGTDLTPAREWIAFFMINKSKSWEATPFPNIRKLAPAHALVIEKEQHRRYKYFRFNEEQTLFFSTSEEAVAAYKEQLDRAILSRFTSAYPLGFELSGGLDSSTITSYAGHYLPEEQQRKIQAFGHSLRELDPAAIHAVSRRYTISATHIMPMDPYSRQAALRAIAILGFPVEHAAAFTSDPFCRLAEQQGIRTLFSGFGGDEFVTTPGGLLLKELIQQKRWTTLFSKLPGNPLTRTLRFLKHVWTFHRTAGNMQHPALFKAISERWRYQYVNADTIQKYDLKTRSLQGVRYTAGHVRLNSFLLQDRWAPFVPTRTETGSLLAAARGLEYRWPLLDHRLIQHFLATDSLEKYHCGMGRYLHRRAVSGLVPDRITWFPSKDMGQLTNRRIPHAPDHHFSIQSLHPLLASLVDIKKLTVQQQQLKNSSFFSSDKKYIRQFHRNIHCLRWLDIWLKDYLHI